MQLLERRQGTVLMGTETRVQNAATAVVDHGAYIVHCLRDDDPGPFAPLEHAQALFVVAGR